MKKLWILLCLIIGLYGCGGSGGSEDQEGTSSEAQALALNQEVSETIAAKGEVDWYAYTAVEANRTLNVECAGTYHNSPVDFMVTVYERDAQGNLTPIIGESAAEDAYPTANILLKVRIQGRRDLRIAVRDFKDDDASDRIPYRLRVFYTDSSNTTDNSNFAQATALQVNASGECLSDQIAEVGEVNCYSFQIASAGVYRVAAQFDAGDLQTMPAGFNLGAELYDEAGNLIHQIKGPRPMNLQYVFLVHLQQGGYYLVVDDQNRADTFARPYSVCVDSVDVEESNTNDSMANAEARAEATEGYVLDGILDYIQDEDWYAVNVPRDSGVTSHNIKIDFARGFDEVPESISSQANPPSYKVTVRDAEGVALYEFDHPVSSLAPLSVEIGRGTGNVHYITVKPVIQNQLPEALPYQMRVSLPEVSDPGENPDGSEVPPTTLNSGETVTGKIYKIGDVDNYQIHVDTTSGPKVLEVFFDTTESSTVDYVVDVTYNTTHRILRDRNGNANGADEGAHFKSSFYFSAATDVVLQVGDDQGNSGSQVAYALRVNVLDVPGVLGAVYPAAASIVSSPVYFAESAERAAASGIDVTVVEYNDHNQPQFKADTTLLKVDALDANSWQSDWIAGFIDYDGDRDLFELNFDAITRAQGAPANWYFDIQVHMYAPASNVEYSWALFRDGEPLNNVLLERTFWSNTSGAVFEYDFDGEGVVAAWADDNIASANIDKIVPETADQRFWIGHLWNQSKFYLSVQDFNRAVMANNGNVATPNQVPDNDWGNINSSPSVTPYYFRVSVTYHPGCSNPDSCAP